MAEHAHARPFSPQMLEEHRWLPCQSVDGTPRSHAWAVPWSDLMMTMFVLFVVLYAVQAPRPVPSGAREVPVQAVFPAVLPPAVVLPGDLIQAADAMQPLANAPGVLAVETLPGGVRLAVTPDAAHTPQPLLSRVAEALTRSAATVHVIGYSAHGASWTQAAQAAAAVAQVLRQRGVAEDRLWVTARSSEAHDPALARGWVDIVLGSVEVLPPPHLPGEAPGIAAWLQGGM
ncbi:flagellar motor protein MotB [Thermodesulfomicrobium sp. WS]|uniref:flagellar motor protein MotB n=1 Tax=Thermodesulfomicrobium sp. WS TaxID=3004129 RepID=UPI00248F8E36|nr:flagellar motor protein MotB [Thermodesulfomicrobium sp. WS]